MLFKKENKTTLYYAAKQKDENIFEIILGHETIKREIIEETFKLLLNDGGAGNRSIKIAKILMGQTLGDKVEQETEYFSKTNIIAQHFVEIMKKQENENIFKTMMKSITKSFIQLITQFKPISNDILMILMNLKDENTNELLKDIIQLMKEIFDPNKFHL